MALWLLFHFIIYNLSKWAVSIELEKKILFIQNVIGMVMESEWNWKVSYQNAIVFGEIIKQVLIHSQTSGRELNRGTRTKGQHPCVQRNHGTVPRDWFWRWDLFWKDIAIKSDPVWAAVQCKINRNVLRLLVLLNAW